ncbi:MAG TPA: DUF5615 family PIN-like protein [Gemmataceae bacterium]|jgi:hypothetical protein|nr:DUF5615 family PIN-like protein [Gemmataceae bacterium]
MSSIRFLMDRDIDHDMVRALHAMEPLVDILCVGDPDGPTGNTKDSELLELAQGMDRVLVSRDKKTMPGHLKDRYAAGKHTSGVILIRKPSPIKPLAEDLLLIWSANTAEEWVDRIVYLPL